MATQHVENLIIGAGQAGLATGYHLQQLGRDFLVIDANDRIGENWRCHYDSLTLYTPARASHLPGMAFPAEDPWEFPTKDQVAAYLEAYAVEFDLPVRLQTRVDRLQPDEGGGFTATIGAETITCDNVVVATGTFGRTARVPEFASDLDPAITQLHSSQYHRPSDLSPGSVLVVGAAHSGCDLAFELAQSHKTILVGPDRGAIPVQWDSREFKVVYPVLEFIFAHVLNRRTPIGRKKMPLVRTHGGPALRIKERQLTGRGVQWLKDHITEVRDGLPVTSDGRVLEVSNVVWCTGFRQDFSWIELPVRGEDGWPQEYRGEATSVPGLYFCGLSFQYSFASMLLPGVGRDAAYVAGKIDERSRAVAIQSS